MRCLLTLAAVVSWLLTMAAWITHETLRGYARTVEPDPAWLELVWTGGPAACVCLFVVSMVLAAAAAAANVK